MRFDDKKSALAHLTSMKGDNGVIIEDYEEIILRLPTRKSQYANELAQRGIDSGSDPSLQYEDVNKCVKNAVNGVWELFAKRSGQWVRMR